MLMKIILKGSRYMYIGGHGHMDIDMDIGSFLKKYSIMNYGGSYTNFQHGQMTTYRLLDRHTINEGSFNGDITASKLLTRNYTIQNLRRFLNEILCIRVAQGAAKLQEVKI